jgi:hypothetical protein
MAISKGNKVHKKGKTVSKKKVIVKSIKDNPAVEIKEITPFEQKVLLLAKKLKAAKEKKEAFRKKMVNLWKLHK